MCHWFCLLTFDRAFSWANDQPTCPQVWEKNQPVLVARSPLHLVLLSLQARHFHKRKKPQNQVRLLQSQGSRCTNKYKLCDRVATRVAWKLFLISQIRERGETKRSTTCSLHGWSGTAGKIRATNLLAAVLIMVPGETFAAINLNL